MRRFNVPRTYRAITMALMLSALHMASVAQEIDPNSIVTAGLQAARMIDIGKAADIWDGASAVARQRVSKPQFLQSVTAARQTLGAVKERTWWGINRAVSGGTADLPAGTYVNVEYVTTFSSGKTARELLSFRLDEDRQWRVTGYFLR